MHATKNLKGKKRRTRVLLRISVGVSSEIAIEIKIGDGFSNGNNFRVVLSVGIVGEDG